MKESSAALGLALRGNSLLHHKLSAIAIQHPEAKAYSGSGWKLDNYKPK